MRRKAAAVLALVAGTSGPALSMGATVTEHFNTITDLYWDHQGNTTAPQNYGW